MKLRSALLALAVVLLSGAAASADWGTIKGQVVVKGEVPAPAKLDVNKDQAHCLSKGNIVSEKWVVDKNTKGLRWVMVWVAADGEGKANHTGDLKIHPDRMAVPKSPVVIDQPCCKFEPHVVGMRLGQDFIGKNSSPIVHNMLIQGGNGVNLNPIIVAGGQIDVAANKWKAHYLPTSISCSIHNWMSAKLFVFAHPYFAVTDEQGNFEIKDVPAGKLRVMMWHEGSGWVVKEKGGKGSDGVARTVEAGKTLDLGKIELKYSDD